ncbi:hypothetical protein DL93DRAFT_165323 [Clavulina sp. PMI_390]|nr:hypothetical protein DL93DRAFT_165323 [Clavulina sp. PMI_390]
MDPSFVIFGFAAKVTAAGVDAPCFAFTAGPLTGEGGGDFFTPALGPEVGEGFEGRAGAAAVVGDGCFPAVGARGAATGDGGADFFARLGINGTLFCAPARSADLPGTDSLPFVVVALASRPPNKPASFPRMKSPIRL